MKIEDQQHRRDRLISLLRLHGSVAPQALADILNVSVQTIRADIRVLDEQAVVHRKNGAVRLRQPSENIGYTPRLNMALLEKKAIAHVVSTLVSDGARLALGTGTTAEECARQLVDKEGLFIVTNNIHSLMALQLAKDVVIMLAGGKVRLRDLDMVGSDSCAFFAKYRVDFAIFSCGGISETGDVMDYNPDEIDARRAITECAHRSILVVDSTKYNKDLPCRHKMVWEYDYVVSTADYAPSILHKCTENNCTVINPNNHKLPSSAHPGHR